MSEFNWCHGPDCHKSHTLDRVRGVKGSKVLRTRKVPINSWTRNTQWSFFCSQGCMHDFWKEYASEIVKIAPRTEALETPIHNPVKDTEDYWQRWKIEVDETRQQ